MRITVRTGTAPPAPSAPPRRLVLTAAEWAVLVEGRPGDLPPAFRPHPVGLAERDAAVAALTGRGVLRSPGGAAEPVPAVAADLAVLHHPLLTVRLAVDGRGGARHGWFAVGAGGVVVVLTLPDGGVELSLAPAARLGAELSRAVPEAAVVTGSATEGGSPPAEVLPAGVLPLHLLDGAVAGGQPPTPEEAALADELLRRTAGSLRCLVLGRTGSSLGAGQVSWLATDGGWATLRPRPATASPRLVEVVPVRPADLGVEIAPTVAALLAAGS
ncbi:hypothetical protein [Blastococcus sp. VKM Ac-2987]|uniref:hypothetical protein n=1 Tax=Blastococcus sp. VKM Ac-2987 TaxID=3004141 RepID=UPI0022AB98C8|nr:hypothetical protein [Blastococcus sp. VKM Ac-2987]MCZ2857271.1 hypothetical protein [Blastococcus sp. VKM Ac-2987]